MKVEEEIWQRKEGEEFGNEVDGWTGNLCVDERKDLLSLNIDLLPFADLRLLPVVAHTLE